MAIVATGGKITKRNLAASGIHQAMQDAAMRLRAVHKALRFSTFERHPSQYAIMDKSLDIESIVTESGVVTAWHNDGAPVGANTRGCVYLSIVVWRAR